METTNTNPDNLARRWAAGFLGTAENASPLEAGSAYLRKLREQEFAPTGQLHSALAVFQQKALPAAAEEQIRIEEETRLRAEIGEFANEFFRLPLNIRLDRWKKLVFRSQHLPPLSARLQDLKDGLNVEVGSGPLDESFAGKLAAHLVESFPLSRLGRVAARQAFLRAIEDGTSPADLKSWEKTARYLRGEWPSIAALDYDLVKQISSLRWRLRQRDKMERPSRFVPNNPQKSDWGWLWILIFIGFLLKGITSITSTTSTTSTSVPSPSSYTSPPPIYSPTSRMQFAHPHLSFTGGVPVSELFDPAKFDVEVIGSQETTRSARFTPRISSFQSTKDGIKANTSDPIVVGEATMRLIGIPKADIEALFARAAQGESPASSPGARPESPKYVKPSKSGDGRQ